MRKSLVARINGLPRNWKRGILLVFDALALIFILWLSYSVRLGTNFVPSTTQLGLMATAPVLAIPIFIRMGLYRAVIRYLPDRAVWTIVQAMTLATLAWVALLFLADMSGITGVPRSIPLIYWAFGIMVLAGSRFAAKRLLWNPAAPNNPSDQVLIYGAGKAGSELAMALRAHGSQYVAGFLDDDSALQGRDVFGIRVYAPSQLGHLIHNVGIKEVILCMPSASAAERQKIFAKVNAHPVTIRTLPAIADIASGRYLINQLREIDIDDLLGRSAVPADPELLRVMLENKVVLVSGAGGSIGSELCRLIARWKPEKLVLFEFSEFALYEIHRELEARNGVEIVPILGSVTDETLVEQTLTEHGVDVVFHAAAHKHVPLVEANPIEGVRNNVIGTRIMAEASFAAGVEHFVLISTDKAVHPTSVMGASKWWAELIVQRVGEKAAEAGGGQKFCAVRFGNVLGSNGSVVPLFKEQIAHGGPVTLTNERMTRYFMSIHEAGELIVQAGALSEGGDTFMLEMGEPVTIRSLAENMIRLAELSVRDEKNPGGDIEITVTGSRPGEKLREDLFYDPAMVEQTSQQKILRARHLQMDEAAFAQGLKRLEKALDRRDQTALRAVLFSLSEDAAATPAPTSLSQSPQEEKTP